MMKNYDFSLQNYLKCPLNIEFNLNLNSQKIVKSLRKLAFRWFDIGLFRWYHIKEIRNILIEEEFLKEFSINLSYSLKAKAYMKDCGEIYISLGALLFKSNMTTFKVLCHEVAHIWLSQQPFYSSLKELNKEFKQKYYKIEKVYLASPIELYAMVISVELMKSLLPSLTKKNEITRLNKFIDLECAKILELSKLIQTL